MRTRQQRGYIWSERGWWYLRFYDSLVQDGVLVRKQRSQKLAPVEAGHKRLKQPPEYIRQMANLILKPLNNSDYDPAKNLTIGGFVSGTFFPHREARAARSTVCTDRQRWNKHVESRCASKRLRDFSPWDVQQLLDDIARANPELTGKTHSRIKSLLSAIFKRAINQGFRPGPNPVRDSEVPHGPPGRETVAYDVRTVLRILELLPEPARTVAGVAAFTGLRQGEIEGLQWEAYSGEELKVLRSMWRGHVCKPKTRSSKASVPVVAPLRNLLDQHRLMCGNPQTGIMFSSRNKTPISMNNLLHYQIRPILRLAGIKWHGWHAFRRGIATVLHDLSVDDKTIQAILRHSNVAVTQQCYIKTLPTQSIDAMKRLEGLFVAVIPGSMQ